MYHVDVQLHFTRFTPGWSWTTCRGSWTRLGRRHHTVLVVSSNRGSFVRCQRCQRCQARMKQKQHMEKSDKSRSQGLTGATQLRRSGKITVKIMGKASNRRRRFTYEVTRGYEAEGIYDAEVALSPRFGEPEIHPKLAIVDGKYCETTADQGKTQSGTCLQFVK